MSSATGIPLRRLACSAVLFARWAAVQRVSIFPIRRRIHCSPLMNSMIVQRDRVVIPVFSEAGRANRILARGGTRWPDTTPNDFRWTRPSNWLTSAEDWTRSLTCNA